MIITKILILILFVINLKPDLKAQSDLSMEITRFETAPRFEGEGLNKFLNFVYDTLIWPENAKYEVIDGEVTVSFQVDSTGELTDIKIEKSLRSDFDKAATEAVRKSPKWEPATVNNKPVTAYLSVPIRFHNDKKIIKDLKKAKKH